MIIIKSVLFAPVANTDTAQDGFMQILSNRQKLLRGTNCGLTLIFAGIVVSGYAINIFLSHNLSVPNALHRGQRKGRILDE